MDRRSEKADTESKAGAMPNWTSENVPIHPMRLAKEINDFMNKDSDIIIADGGDTTTWNGMTRTMKCGGHYLDYGLFGSLAVGLPYANAAKLIHPDSRVLLLAETVLSVSILWNLKHLSERVSPL